MKMGNIVKRKSKYKILRKEELFKIVFVNSKTKNFIVKSLKDGKFFDFRPDKLITVLHLRLD